MLEKDQITALLREVSLDNSQQAYRRLFVALHKPLTRFAYGILKSNDDAEEAVSDVFITIWEKRDSLVNIESPLLYFYTAVKHRAFNIITRQKRQEAQDAGQWLVPTSSVYFNPEQLLISQEVVLQIRKAINDLPARCRLIFILVKEDGLKYKEVAELLQISVKTVEAQMAIALRRISQCMHLSIPAHHPKLTQK